MQLVNYHLRTLERHGLVELVEERKKGNVTERVMQATAASFVISPTALASVQPDPARSPDRLSARWLLALAAQLVRDVGSLVTGATEARKRVATFAIDGEIRFASAADRAAIGPVASVVRSSVASWQTTTSPSDDKWTSSSRPSAPAARPASNAGIVFSGPRARPPRCAKTSGRLEAR